MVKSIEKLNKKVGTKKTVKKQTVKKEKPTEIIKVIEVEKKIDTVDPMMAMMQSMTEMINQLKEQNELLKNQNNNQVVIKDDDQPKEKQIKDEIIYEIVWNLEWTSYTTHVFWNTKDYESAKSKLQQVVAEWRNKPFPPWSESPLFFKDFHISENKLKTFIS